GAGSFPSDPAAQEPNPLAVKQRKPKRKQFRHSPRGQLRHANAPHEAAAIRQGKRLPTLRRNCAVARRANDHRLAHQAFERLPACQGVLQPHHPNLNRTDNEEISSVISLPKSRGTRQSATMKAAASYCLFFGTDMS